MLSQINADKGLETSHEEIIIMYMTAYRSKQ